MVKKEVTMYDEARPKDFPAALMWDKYDVIMILCMIGISVTTIYLWDCFYAWTRMAWAIWGACIYIGTIAAYRQEIEELKKQKRC